MIMESVMDFSSTNSSSNASSPRGSPPTMKPPASPPSTPPRDATPTNNNNNISNNNNTKEAIERASPQRVPASPMESPMQHPLLQGPPHGPHGPHGPPHPMPPPHHMSQMRHLGPPGLGLFNSLMGSPLEFMAAAQAQAQAHQQQHPQQHPPRAYNSPPPISSSDPTANECKLVTYRGQKVAAFMISGETMLCLPQAFELFLKHLVGGLHTVYTKLKRLDIVPLVCNVEQVRILRGLGAIQPGVNRCKLLSCKDFDTLYRDCTTASRPGRPPKRVPMGLNLPASLQGHPQLKKHRLENGDFAPFENGPMSEPRMEKSPLLSNGYNAPPTHLHPMHQFYHPGLPHPGSVLKGQAGAPLEAIARSGIWEDCRAAYEDIVKHLERLRDGRGEQEEQRVRMAGQGGERGERGEQDYSNGHSPVLNLSKGTAGSSAGSRASNASPVDHSDSEAGASDKEDDDDLNSNPEDEDGHHHHQDAKPARSSPGSSPPPGLQSGLPTNLAHLTVGVGVAPLAGLGLAAAGLGAKASVGGDPRLTSTETILRNIEGLLQVAADNARQQERQISMEKAELKMDVMREREVKESLERQLLDETRTRVLCQKRLKKVRRASRRLQEQLELEMKRRSQLEEVLRTTGASSEALRILTEMKASSSEMTAPRSPAEQAGSPTLPGLPAPPPPVSSALPLTQARSAAFWQNYSENLAQELENERKAKQKDQQLLSQHDSEAIAMDLENSKPLVQDLRWPTEHRAAIIS